MRHYEVTLHTESLRVQGGRSPKTQGKAWLSVSPAPEELFFAHALREAIDPPTVEAATNPMPFSESDFRGSAVLPHAIRMQLESGEILRLSVVSREGTYQIVTPEVCGVDGELEALLGRLQVTLEYALNRRTPEWRLLRDTIYTASHKLLASARDAGREECDRFLHDAKAFAKERAQEEADSVRQYVWDRLGDIGYPGDGDDPTVEGYIAYREGKIREDYRDFVAAYGEDVDRKLAAMAQRVAKLEAENAFLLQREKVVFQQLTPRKPRSRLAALAARLNLL